MVDSFSAEMAVERWGLWAVEMSGGPPFVGMIGLHRVNPLVPCAPAVEIAWRLQPDYWGRGYATEGASAAMRYGFNEGALPEIVAFTTTVNERSQGVMARIGMTRDLYGDFDHPSVPEGSPLRRHVLVRARPAG